MNKKTNKNFITRCLIVVLIIGFYFLNNHLCIVYGALKERKSQNCIKGSELVMWENTLKIAQSICVDVQINQLDDIKRNYQEKIKIAEEEAEKWRGYYLYQKKQVEEAKIDKDISINK